jgi:hypothetical protein
MPDTTNYNSLAGTLLTRGNVTPPGTSIPAGATVVADAICAGTDELVVEADMNGAVATDLVPTVQPYEADGVTLLPGITLTAMVANGPTLTGGKVAYVGRFDVTAFEKVQVQLKNNNAGAQTMNRASWRVGV